MASKGFWVVFPMIIRTAKGEDLMKSEMPRFDAKMLAYCGLYCAACSFKTAHDEENPKHLEQLPFSFALKELSSYNCECCKGYCICGPCQIKPCAAGKQLSSCGECKDFPCGHILAFEEDGMPHHRQAVENLRQIRAQGTEVWFQSIAPALHCPRCGAKQTWYYHCDCQEK